MLRFPNPGSNIDNFVKIYVAIFKRLNGYIVTLDDIVQATIESNLVTSCGYTGEEAVSRSTRSDRTRDPLYNQLKMYAECYRLLGWMHPTENSSLNYTFTLLGAEVVNANYNYLALLEECLLGIVYPTPIISVKGNYNIRPFVFLLKTAKEVGGHISKDEMIVGPLNTLSDQNSDSLHNIVSTIQSMRESDSSAKYMLNKVSIERGIKISTLGNYTRWPIAMLRDVGWVKKGKIAYDSGKKYDTWFLTEKGHSIVHRLTSAIDLRNDNIETLTIKQKSTFALCQHVKMLERANLTKGIAEVVDPNITKELEILGLNNENILFSPFQSLPVSDINHAFNLSIDEPKLISNSHKDLLNIEKHGRNNRNHLFVSPIMIPSTNSNNENYCNLYDALKLLNKDYCTIEETAKVFTLQHSSDTQHTFYPLVIELFRILGYSGEYSRAGVNYQRWDGYIWVDNHMIPIEIKSPTEEQCLSTKAIRQALENKVILMSRGELTKKLDITSLVVGYNLPNERGEMSNLIDDVFNTFKINIGVFDLLTLTSLALQSITNEVSLSKLQLKTLRGYLNA
jgi:hypothetical protein